CIVYILYVVLSTQLSFKIPYIPTQSAKPFDNSVNYHIANFNWMMNTSGWLLGITTTWKMFSPTDKLNWHQNITLVYEDGSRAALPNLLTTDRTFFERNFADYREAKFQL